jgi:hypothetical protein
MKKGIAIRHILPFMLALAVYSNASSQEANESSARKLPPTVNANGQHDFDFEIGSWKTELKRLVKPLSGSTTWVAYEGTTVVRKVWEGKANLVELNVTGPGGSFTGLSLRLYDPQTRQWSLNFANISGGGMAIPAIGSFKDGRGEFYNQETYNGRSIFF